MAPGKVSKMKQVCAASPGKFASALLDILDESAELHSDLPAPQLYATSKTPEKQGATRKRPAAALVEAQFKRAKTAGINSKLEEKRVAADRRKQLKSVKFGRIKDMAQHKALGAGTKHRMIEGIIASEAKGRENVRKHKASIQDVVVRKREEFEKMTTKGLKELLQAYALQTGGTKPERVDRLLQSWKDQGEIEKVVAGRAYKARKAELIAMDKVALYELCRKKGVDGLSKDILIDRLLMHESVAIWQEVVEAQH